MTGLLGAAYTVNQMSYDLARLRLNGLIERLPDTNTYTLTAEGNASRSSTPRSTTGCCGRCWPPTNRPHRPSYAPHCTPSTHHVTQLHRPRPPAKGSLKLKINSQKS